MGCAPRSVSSGAEYHWPDIAAGTYDTAYIDPIATNIKNYGGLVFFVFHTEMNAASSAQGGAWGTDAEFFLAAKHIKDRFSAIGANNAKFVWCPSGYKDTISRWNTLWGGVDGDAVWDWVGYDPYSTGASGGWEDFHNVFDTKYPVLAWAPGTHPTYNKTGSHTKPLMLVEWGAEEFNGVANSGTYPNTKAGFFDQMASLLKTSPYSAIKAIVYYDSPTTAGDCFDTGTDAITAFTNLAQDPFFNPSLAPAPPPAPAGDFRTGAAVEQNDGSTSLDLVIPDGSGGSVAVQVGDWVGLIYSCTRAALRNACEGTNAAAITTANSNSKGSDKFDGVVGTSFTYSTAQLLGGTSSAHPSVSAATTSAGWWEASFGAKSSYKTPFYFRLPSVPTAICRMFQEESPAGAALHWGFGIDTTGKMIIRDIGAAVTRATSTASPALNTWHRVDISADWNETAQTIIVSFSLFLGANLNGTTPDETKTTAAFAQTTTPGRYRYGVHFSTSNTWDYFFVHPTLDDYSLPGAYGTLPVITDPAGWSVKSTRDNVSISVDLRSRFYARQAIATDPGSTIHLATDCKVHGSALLFVYKNADPTTPVDVFQSSVRASDSGSVTSPNATTTTPNDKVLTVGVDRAVPGTSSWTAPTGDTLRVAGYGVVGSGMRVSSFVSDDGAAHAVGTYGSKVSVASSSGYLAIAWTIALSPAPVPVPSPAPSVPIPAATLPIETGKWRRIGFRYDLLNVKEDYKKTLDTVQECTIDWNGDDNIMRTATITIQDDPDIDWYSDRIQVWFLGQQTVGGSVFEYPLGIFLFLAPPRTVQSYNIYRTVQAYDKTWELDNSFFATSGNVSGGGNSVFAGQNMADVVAYLIDAGDVDTIDPTDTQIPPDDTTFPTAKQWDKGSPRLTAINETLDLMGFFSLYVDGFGVRKSRPIPNFETEGAQFTYATDDDSWVQYPLTDEILNTRFWNQVLIIGENPSSSTKYYSLLTNNREDSPVSVPSIGRVIMAPPVTVQDISSQTQIDNIARVRLQEGARLIQQVQFNTPIVPDHESFAVVSLNCSVPGQDEITGTFVERQWSIECKPGGLMRHTFQRVIPTVDVT